MKNFTLFYTSFLVLIMLSCEHKVIEFHKAKWNKKVDGFYLHREEMIEDVMSSYLRKGMSYKEVQLLLGKPENYSDLEENIITYRIMEDYGWNIDPVETKSLRIELTNDSLVSNYRIMHWKN